MKNKPPAPRDPAQLSSIKVPPTEPTTSHVSKTKPNDSNVPTSVSVSSMDLAANLTPINFGTDTKQIGVRVRFVSQRQLNDNKQLKDISNSLHIKMPHFKPKETGPKALSKDQSKENATWAELGSGILVHNKDPLFHFSYPAHLNGLMRVESLSHPGRPPDLTSVFSASNALDSSHTPSSKNSTDSDRGEQFREAQEVHEDVQNRTMEEDSPIARVSTEDPHHRS